jgi:hypothetical protein
VSFRALSALTRERPRDTQPHPVLCAHVCFPEAILPDDFARVCVANGLLRTKAATLRLSSALGSVDAGDRPLEEVFQGLRAAYVQCAAFKDYAHVTFPDYLAIRHYIMLEAVAVAAAVTRK